jgi:pyruvate dehydrogenase E1 component alpha subunit
MHENGRSTDDTLRYLDDGGEVLAELPFAAEELVRAYQAMRRARLFDERAVLLQRQGRLGVYAPFSGQEASQIGPALALGPQDWLLPSYRETGAALLRGLPLEHAILYWRAHPAGWRFPDEVRILPFYIPIATQLLHAVGVASAGRHLGEDWVALTFIGDGGSSEGDFHEALNFAAVFSAPVVFVAVNNGWAISTPTERQMNNTRIVDRALGYGIPGVRVDGNDLVATWQAGREAVERARAGGGPTLIEAISYRVVPHTTGDDPDRYRDPALAESWRARDPLLRLRRALEGAGVWDEAHEAALLERLRVEWDGALQRADEAPEVLPETIVEQVFAEMTADERAAWEALRDR